MKRSSQLIDTLEKFVSSTLNFKRDTGNIRKQEFRCSSLPVCPVRWILNETEYNGELPDEDNFGLSWFAGIGTTVHTVLQRVAGLNGQIYGDWGYFPTVMHKGVEYRSTSIKIVEKGKVGPRKKDNLELEYVELIVRDPKTGLSGHVDCLIYVKDLDGYIVLDFKTSSLKKIEEMTKEPPVNYHHQINSYAYMLEHFGPYDPETKTFRKPLKILGTCIMFLARDNPFHKEFGTKLYFQFDYDKNIFEQNTKNFLIAQKALETGKFKKAISSRLCTTKEDAKESGCDFCSMGCGISDEKILKNVRSSYKNWKD